jgi:tetratricopeptide (TPR) repeat protein
MSMRAKRYRVALAALVAGILTACVVYSEEPLRVKGIKSFQDEKSPAPSISEPAAKTQPDKAVGPEADINDYDFVLAEIESLRKRNDELEKELEDIRARPQAPADNAAEPADPGNFVKEKKKARPIDMKRTEQDAIKKKNRELASEIKESMAKAREDKSKLYFELGNAYTKAKLYKNAIDAYLECLKANPKNYEAHYNLGLVYQRYQGDTDKAVYHFKRYLASNPSPDRKRDVQYLLAMLQSGRSWLTTNN